MSSPHRPPPREPARRHVVGLGSNLGDRAAFIDAARHALASLPLSSLDACASIIETAPVGGPPQGAYLNTAVLLTTTLPPLDLLAHALRIERALGRERIERWGPRTIDIDLLFAEGLQLSTPELTVPHPRLHERAFALAPLVELLPEARDPRTGARYADMLASLR